MTEEEWLAATDIERLLHCLELFRPGERKLRLFTIACCRRIWDVITEERVRQALDLVERFADGGVPRAVMVEGVAEIYFGLSRSRSPFAQLVDKLGQHPSPYVEAYRTVAYVAAYPQGPQAGTAVNDRRTARERMDRFHYELAEQAVLLRHIIGNPFRPHPPLPHVPTTVRDLAEAVYHSEQAAVGPLHDALLDAGLTALADHFTAATEWHPKGCWAIDALTGRA